MDAVARSDVVRMVESEGWSARVAEFREHFDSCWAQTHEWVQLFAQSSIVADAQKLNEAINIAIGDAAAAQAALRVRIWADALPVVEAVRAARGSSQDLVYLVNCIADARDSVAEISASLRRQFSPEVDGALLRELRMLSEARSAIAEVFAAQWSPNARDPSAMLIELRGVGHVIEAQPIPVIDDCAAERQQGFDDTDGRSVPLPVPAAHVPILMLEKLSEELAMSIRAEVHVERPCVHWPGSPYDQSIVIESRVSGGRVHLRLFTPDRERLDLIVPHSRHVVRLRATYEVLDSRDAGNDDCY